MKKYILMMILSLFSVVLLAQTPEVQAERTAYKHERNTIFGIKEGNKFHAFKYGDEITNLGYVTFTGSPYTTIQTDALELESSKHMSESYFFMIVDNTYHLYYKNYMGEPRLITSSEKLTTEGNGMKAMATSLTEVTSDEPKAKPKQAKSEPAADDDDDDGGGISWWIWLLVGWFVLRLVFD